MFSKHENIPNNSQSIRSNVQTTEDKYKWQDLMEVEKVHNYRNANIATNNHQINKFPHQNVVPEPFMVYT